MYNFNKIEASYYGLCNITDLEIVIRNKLILRIDRKTS